MKLMGDLRGKLETFKPDGQQRAFTRWFNRVTSRGIKDFYRDQKKQCENYRAEEIETLSITQADEEADQWTPSEQAMLARQAWELLSPQLKTWEREAFQRLVFHGDTVKDVASEVGKSEGTVRNSKCTILKRLRREFHGLIDVDVRAPGDEESGL